MYLQPPYWESLIGGTDDTLTLVQFLADLEQETINVGDVFRRLNLNRDTIRSSGLKCEWVPQDNPDRDPCYAEFYYAIDVIMDMGALLLEMRKSGRLVLSELFGRKFEAKYPEISLVYAPEDVDLIRFALLDFTGHLDDYGIAEMLDEEEKKTLRGDCLSLCTELWRV